ncbi:MAG: recombinase family protein [Burkholderiaceae bacterium]|nr:recombinase family protein [Burkholderiaceae bacterium]
MNATATAAGRLFGYGRVSTTDQTPENQRRELEQAGFAIDLRRWFADTISGKVPAMQRPQFAKLIDRIEEGDSLVVAKLDRLGRDSMDVEQTLRYLEERGVSVVVLQLGKTDLTSSAGKLIRRVLGAVADMERDLLIERTQAGLARAKAEGKQLGRRWKTTEEQRAEIRQRHEAGEAVSALARDFGISRGSVLNAVRRTADATG